MSIQQPCNRWQHLLAARHPDDLTATERAALAQHLATCTACTVTRADYDMLTQRIRTLPAPSAQPLPQFAMPQQEAKAISEHPELDLLPLPERLSSPPRRSRFARTTNVLAAALLLVVLIGSSLLLFSHRPQATTGGPTVEPVHLVPQPLKSCLSDPGLDKICTEGYYKLVHITQKFNGPQNFTLTINRLYADSNRIVVGYTLLDSHGHVPDVLPHGLQSEQYDVTLSIQTLNGHTRPVWVLQSSGFYGMEGSENEIRNADIKNFTGMMFATFEEPQYIPYATQQIPTGTQELSLRLQAALSMNSSTDTQPSQGVTTTQPVDLGRAYFDVTMPFHQGNVLHPHATPTGQGVSDLSIDYIVVSLSETYVQLKGRQTMTVMEDQSNKVSTVLNINGTKSYTGLDSWLDANKYYESLFQQPLYNEHGTWKLQITVHDPSGKVIKSAMFTFTYQ
ncbi:MAG TPA: hypothetical protein DHW02_24190 [Ktedonobacter sp.]|nr:hypothetical protein [Ktedonobacter sp.]